MVWQVIEEMAERDGVVRWCLFVLLKGDKPDAGIRPFASGDWSVAAGHSSELAGKQAFAAGRAEAAAEAARLNRAAKPPRGYRRP